MDPRRRDLVCRSLRLVLEFGSTSTAHVVHRFDPLYASNSSLVVLTTLALDGPQRPNQLQPLTGLTSAGLSHLLDRLQEAGVVTRAAGGLAHDQRAVVVALTAAGRRREAAVVAAAMAGLEEAAPSVKEVIGTLELAGARRIASVPPTRATRAASQATRALALTGIRMVKALQSPDSENGGTDHSAALALAVIAEAGPCRPGHLTDLLSLTSGGTTRLLDRLEKNGFIERAFGSVPSDRRSVVVTTTPSGLAQLDLVLERVSMYLDDLLAGVLAVARLIDLDDV